MRHPEAGAGVQIREMLVDRGVLSVEETFVRRNFGYKTFTDIPIPRSAHGDAERFPFVDSNLSSNQKLFFITAEVRQRQPMQHPCLLLEAGPDWPGRVSAQPERMQRR